MITITLTGESLSDIENQLAAIFPHKKTPVVPMPEAAKAEKPAKAEKSAKSTKVEEAVDDLDAEEAADTDNPSVTGDDVRAAIAVAAKAGHRDAVKETLKKYKAKNVTELDQKHYQSVIDDLELL